MMYERKDFIFGVDGLDVLLRGALLPGTLVVIAGHPGSGKTTLAATMCYANAVRGKRCLYVSVQEPRDKFMMYMDLLGIRLRDLEGSGNFRYVKLPQMAGPEGGFEAGDFINHQIDEFRPDIVVVDSITPILKAFGDDLKARSVLQEYFSEVLRRTGGLMVLLSEIPLLDGSMGIGDIEFVADVILFLKHSIQRNRLVREVEIRKARGSPITMARVPFSIERGVGLRVWAPPPLEEIPGRLTEKVYELPCSLLRDVVGRLYGGMVVYITYPPDARPHQIFPFFLAFMGMNKVRTLVFTYRLSPEHFHQLLREYLEKLECGREAMDLFERYTMDIIGFNPAALSVEELYARELRIIYDRSPDVVVFVGTDMSFPTSDTYIDLLKNQLLFFRKKGILTFRLGAFIDTESYNINAGLADVVAKYYYRRGGSSRRLRRHLYIWGIGNDPAVLDYDDVELCADEIRKTICEVSAGARNR